MQTYKLRNVSSKPNAFIINKYNCLYRTEKETQNAIWNNLIKDNWSYDHIPLVPLTNNTQESSNQSNSNEPQELCTKELIDSENEIVTLKVDLNESLKGNEVYVTNKRDGSLKRLVFDSTERKKNEFTKSNSISSLQNIVANYDTNGLHKAQQEFIKSSWDQDKENKCTLPPKYLYKTSDGRKTVRASKGDFQRLNQQIDQEYLKYKKKMKREHSKLKTRNKKLANQLENKKSNFDCLVSKQIRKSSSMARKKSAKTLGHSQSLNSQQFVQRATNSSYYTNQSTKVTKEKKSNGSLAKELKQIKTPSFGVPYPEGSLYRTTAHPVSRLSQCLAYSIGQPVCTTDEAAQLNTEHKSPPLNLKDLITDEHKRVHTEEQEDRPSEKSFIVFELTPSKKNKVKRSKSKSKSIWSTTRNYDNFRSFKGGK